ncbi:MAG: hypothetical protein LBM13_03975 [Candidatus Ancillula sp.]|jgi:hypothetical protein|nr:hypothetical protein [Candidatus Ancillula sp.]
MKKNISLILKFFLILLILSFLNLYAFGIIHFHKKETLQNFPTVEQTIESGQEIDGKLEGYADVLYPDNLSYSGDFKNGLFDGKGTLWLKGKWKYSGDFKNGKANGNGVLAPHSGESISGKWENGVFIN